MEPFFQPRCGAPSTDHEAFGLRGVVSSTGWSALPRFSFSEEDDIEHILMTRQGISVWDMDHIRKVNLLIIYDYPTSHGRKPLIPMVARSLWYDFKTKKTDAYTSNAYELLGEELLYD
ncbi:hypothetical protein IV203_003353 [Nitzschia inconspicua]|uniref:Uncharacterized protein n=1 Tax=Nitzschia inconspicua TaxID=303405 RepID=A0A9K3PNK9_9STRA|nr:hypothetical protein IV203_003353 [Nitzschia inconspicua]